MSQISSQKPSVSSLHLSKPGFAQRTRSWLYALWKFSRPHTIVGTSLSVLGLSMIALALSDDLSIFAGWLPIALTWLACLCGNIYIVGLNQLEDVEIDQVNKPHLPIASGEFSHREGWAIVATTGILALIISATQGYFLMATVWLSLLIGTAYSLPPIRLKRFPIWASLCIFTVRGAIVNLGVYSHVNQQLHESSEIPAPVWALTLFILVFTFAIAIFKDIPDLEGDRLYHITTFTVRLGQHAVFNLARWVLVVCYLGMILVATVLPGVNAAFLGMTHLITLGVFWGLSTQVNLQDKTDIAEFYQFIWKLFFLEYLMFPLACLLAH
jgi:homogentisate phytyltransferase/homogentisate geranylgeranyltransferase